MSLTRAGLLRQIREARRTMRRLAKLYPGAFDENSKAIVATTAPKRQCCVCGTTERLRNDGWYGYRCDSDNCVPF